MNEKCHNLRCNTGHGEKGSAIPFYITGKGKKQLKPELTDEQVELEIKRLWDSDAVKLAKKEVNIKYRRRQYLYQLRCMEKRGLKLMEQGIDMDNIEMVLFGSDIDTTGEA